MKYQVKVGEEFSLDSAPQKYKVKKGDPLEIDAVTTVSKSREIAKTVISISLAIVCVPLVLGAAYVGLTDGTFNELQSIGHAISLVAGIVVGHYFLGSDR